MARESSNRRRQSLGRYSARGSMNGCRSSGASSEDWPRRPRRRSNRKSTRDASERNRVDIEQRRDRRGGRFCDGRDGDRDSCGRERERDRVRGVDRRREKDRSQRLQRGDRGSRPERTERCQSADRDLDRGRTRSVRRVSRNRQQAEKVEVDRDKRDSEVSRQRRNRIPTCDRGRCRNPERGAACDGKHQNRDASFRRASTRKRSRHRSSSSHVSYWRRKGPAPRWEGRSNQRSRSSGRDSRRRDPHRQRERKQHYQQPLRRQPRGDSQGRTRQTYSDNSSTQRPTRQASRVSYLGAGGRGGTTYRRRRTSTVRDNCVRSDSLSASNNRRRSSEASRDRGLNAKRKRRPSVRGSKAHGTANGRTTAAVQQVPSYSHESSAEASSEAAESTKKSKKSDRDIVHFDWYEGMWLGDRYRVLDKMGDGTFGRVLRCSDVRARRTVAIKVVRDVPRYTNAAYIEADILRKINRKDVEDESCCVVLLDSFLFNKRHMCLVFERLGKSLYDLLSGNNYRGLYYGDIAQVARHVLKALAFMRECRLTHTDLKPENILLQSEDLVKARPPMQAEDDDHSGVYLRPAELALKIIDFGSATFENDYHSSLINTRQYRAPEVILDLGWDMSSDVWSFGCILMELYTGNVLFRTHEHNEHLSMMERIVEPLPEHMLRKAQQTAGKNYVTVDSRGSPRLRWPEGALSQSSRDRVQRCRPLEELVLPQHRPLADFVRYLLQLDPNRRPLPHEALRHPFVAGTLRDD